MIMLVLSKLYSMLILSKISGHIGRRFLAEQVGVCPGKGCADHIHTVKKVAEKSNRNGDRLSGLHPWTWKRPSNIFQENWPLPYCVASLCQWISLIPGGLSCHHWEGGLELRVKCRRVICVHVASRSGNLSAIAVLVIVAFCMYSMKIVYPQATVDTYADTWEVRAGGVPPAAESFAIVCRFR